MNSYFNAFFKFIFTFTMVMWITPEVLSQNITGYITDDKSNPLPFANIFIRELSSGTSANEMGHYYLTIDPGVYHLVISSVGYKTLTVEVIIKDKTLERDFILQSTDIELNEIIIKSQRKDPAYEIIKKVIDNKEKFLKEVESYKAEIYLRAMEVMDKKEKKKPEQDSNSDDLTQNGPPVDPWEEQKKKEQAKLERINLLELQLTLNYQYPSKYKEERNAYKLYGNKAGLFIPIFNEININFYNNLVKLQGISEVPVISPLSRTAILSYKYKLEESFTEGNLIVYKIKIIPRKTGDATVKGYLYINDATWNINRLELSMSKGALRFYDEFIIKQTYKKLEDDLWIPYKQEFDYETNAGRKTFKGTTVFVYSDYKRDYKFPSDFFGNEVAIINKEAYKRDSSYWNLSRIEPLTTEQKEVVEYRDSIEVAHNTKKYLDSIETRFNKITLGEVLYSGVGFRNGERKTNISISPLAALLAFEVIGGFRLGPYASYYRRFENGRSFYTSGGLSIGLKNSDLQGTLNTWIRYDPFRLGDISLRAGRSFYSINSFDAYLNQLKISNYILHDHVNLFHRIELFNGFYVSTELGFHDRKSISGYNSTSILNKVIKKEDPLYFEDYQALISDLTFSYTPFQRYMTEPNQKVVLGSKFPTFILAHRKGWNNVLTSDINFDYLSFSIEQNLILGVLGNSRYNLTAGKFINSRDLRYVDLKRFRQSDPYLYSDPLHSFQLLDTALSATDLFIEGHYIHHFNGAMINNLPLIKKTKIRTVAGAGFMWVRESNYRHQEVFGGIERIFKIGARRRLRIGLFGVVGQSNKSKVHTGYKISFDLIDTWKRDWSY